MPTANAQLAGVGQAVGEPAGADTDVTAVAKPSTLFEQVGGSFFRSNGDINHLAKDSPTAWDEDLFAAAFEPIQEPGEEPPQAHAQSAGFAGGARCRRKDAGRPLDPAKVSACERIPVIYRYPKSPGRDLWAQDYVGANDGPAGYVADIAWIDGQTAIAVGGDGRYPRHEHARRPAEGYEEWVERDPAGTGRVWLFERGSWRELANQPDPPGGYRAEDGDEIPDAMRGLSAVDCSPTEPRYCVAGGLGQIWEYRDGGFNANPVTDEDLTRAANSRSAFRYRVRDVAFIDPRHTALVLGNDAPAGIEAVATTAGCCVAGAVGDGPTRLVLEDDTWRIDDSTDADAPALDSAYSIMGTPGAFSEVRTRGAPLGIETADESSAVTGVGRQASSNGVHTKDRYTTQEVPARLVSGDGDYLGYCTKSGPHWEATSNPDCGTAGAVPYLYQPNGVFDWAVGHFDTRQAAAFTTAVLKDRLPVGRHGIAEVESPLPFPVVEDDADSYTDRATSRHLFKLSSFALNGLDLYAQQRGWAVGDHGAIVRLGSASGTGSDPDPPSLGQRRPAELTNRTSYSELAPVPREGTAPVPALIDRPEARLDRHRLVPWGTPSADRQVSPDDVTSIVMSRDGSEGWAAGSTASLFRFDGEKWTRCQTDPARGEVGADPACVELAPLGSGTSGLQVMAAARIPYEYDSDPTNDDRFEVVALAGEHRVGPSEPLRFLILRFRDGRWSVDEVATRQVDAQGPLDELADVVFLGPDDGWITGGLGQVWHFDGRGWMRCRTGDAACDDEDGRLPPRTGNGSIEVANNDWRPLQLAQAGERIYLAGTREVSEGDTAAGEDRRPYPMILYRDPGGRWTAANGGYDPGIDQPAEGPDPSLRGRLWSLSVALSAGGGFSGWASGSFGTASTAADSPPVALPASPPVARDRLEQQAGRPAAALHLAVGDDRWAAWDTDDAAADYRYDGPPARDRPDPGQVQVVLDRNGEARGLLAATARTASSGHPLLESGDENRWQLLPAPFFASGFRTLENLEVGATGAQVSAIGPDNRGGAWLAVRGTKVCTPGCELDHDEISFYRYTDGAPQPIFDDAANPITEPITALSGAGDGSVWVATASDRIYRYDRLGGWEGVRVPGWEKGRVRTVVHPMTAVAVGPTGFGVVVGEEGRIANLSPTAVELDPAAGTSCVTTPDPPCGTGRDLKAAAVSADGAALVAGEARTVLYRPPEGAFSAIPPPPIRASKGIVAASLPEQGRAWVASDDGEVFAGTLAGGDWRWSREQAPEPLALPDEHGGIARIADIAVDASGHGYAVGERGLLLERRHDSNGWRRIDTGQLADLTSVTLQAGHGDGALVGGEYGLVLSVHGSRVGVARHAHRFDPLDLSGWGTPEAVGAALLPGSRAGQTDAWVAMRGSPKDRRPQPSRLLRYVSDPADPDLVPSARAEPLADSPREDAEEISFAAFGRQECHLGRAQTCPEPTGSNLTGDAVAKRIVDELSVLRSQGRGPDFALFTGDATDAAGGGLYDATAAEISSPLDTSIKHRRWAELVADRLWRAEVPLFAAIGRQDLSQAATCTLMQAVPCASSREATSETAVTDFTGLGIAARTGASGINLPWREALSRMPAPWGGGPRPDTDLSFRQVPGDAGVDEAAGGGARTHYAVDIERAGERVARLVVLDTSLRSLSAGDAQQNPIEAAGQLEWLDRMTCLSGSGGGSPDCSRDPGQAAIVLTNTPTYSYGPGTATDTQTEFAQVEAILHKNRVSVVVAGRLGWNGLYYSLAPGVHEPAPGGAYPDRAPDSLPGQGRPIPHVVASGGGGEFGPDGAAQGSASEGYWRGYAHIRVRRDGEVLIEQRPVFDWIGITAGEHTITPGAVVRLKGFGREQGGTETPVRYDRIDDNAVTHRYDLLLADPHRPWVPCSAATTSCAALHARLVAATRDSMFASEATTGNPCSPYFCLPRAIGEVDRETGRVTSGNGKHPETFAIATLSVGHRVATWPLVFKPSPSFVITPFEGPPQIPAGASPSAPPPPELPKPQVPNLSVPTPPTLPAIPPLVAATPPEPAPPAPPAPPPPAEQPSPLNLSVAPTGLTVATPTAVIQPPTPPVNPAPPGGARREARQRQAAAQKSGADNAEAQDGAGDLAESPQSPTGAEMTRHESSYQRRESSREQSFRGLGARRAGLGAVRPEPSFSAYSPRNQASPWATGALYGGGITLIAFALAAGWSRGRPTPRRREPRLPAPAYSRVRRPD